MAVKYNTNAPANATTPIRTNHGAWETNGLENPDAYYAVKRTQTVGFGNPDIAKITRLRLISDAGHPNWDVSYCHGELKDGTPVRIRIYGPEYGSFTKHNLMGELIALCKQYKVYGKGIGLFDAISKCSS